MLCYASVVAGRLVRMMNGRMGIDPGWVDRLQWGEGKGGGPGCLQRYGMSNWKNDFATQEGQVRVSFGRAH